MFPNEILLAFLLCCGAGRSVSQDNNEVWRSTGMVKSACDQEEEFQKTGQYPKPIKDHQERICGWWSKGQPRGDACSDIRMHFASCDHETIARHAGSRVINGTDARKAFPSIAYKYVCTGSIVNNEWMLTAAHCSYGVGGAPNEWILGAYDLRDKNNSHYIKARKFREIFHENNVENQPYDDIGMSKVARFKYNDYVQPIVMPPSRDFQYMGPAYFVGYGTIGGRNRTQIAQEVTLPILHLDVCRKVWPRLNITDYHVCAGLFNTGKRTCNGDSGGPLFCCHNYRLMQYGILSGGSRGCGDTPSLFVRLSYYLDWIAKTIKDNS